MTQYRFNILLIGAILLANCFPRVHAAHDHGTPDINRQHAWQKALAKPTLAMSVAFDSRGRLWRASVDNGYVVVQRSDDKGRHFGPGTKVNAESDHIAADGDNRPKIAIAPNGTIYISYTSHLAEPFSGHVHLSRSTDDGHRFSKPVVVNDDRAAISHRFESLIIDPQGRAHLVWLDRRDQIAAKGGNAPYAGVALYHKVFDKDFHGNTERKLVDHTCECCRIAMALDTDGIPVMAWRHVYGRNLRDHAVLRLDEKATPVRVSDDNWAIDACPHHGPALVVSSTGTYHIAWFTNSETRQGLYYARSVDRKTFSAPLPIGDRSSQPSRPALLAHNGTLYLAWKEFDGSATTIRAMSSGDDGATWSAARTVASAASASDHPILVTDQNDVYLSWNAEREGYRLIDITAARIVK